VVHIVEPPGLVVWVPPKPWGLVATACTCGQHFFLPPLPGRRTVDKLTHLNKCIEYEALARFVADFGHRGQLIQSLISGSVNVVLNTCMGTPASYNDSGCDKKYPAMLDFQRCMHMHT
jgi:hypothetical protein